MHMLHSGIDQTRHCAGAAFAPSYSQQRRDQNAAQPEPEPEADEMAYVNVTSRAANVTVADRFSGVLAQIKTMIARRAVYNQTVRELAVLTDRELADLGLSRFDIPTVAREAAY